MLPFAFRIAPNLPTLDHKDRVELCASSGKDLQPLPISALGSGAATEILLSCQQTLEDGITVRPGGTILRVARLGAPSLS